MRQLREGDKIHCKGITCTIAEIAWQEPWSWREAYYLEFTDTNGIYRSWKQNMDGGEAELVDAEMLSDHFIWDFSEEDGYIDVQGKGKLKYEMTLLSEFYDNECMRVCIDGKYYHFG